MINYLNSIYLHTHETVLQTETTNRAIIYQLKKEKKKGLDIEALANVFLKKKHCCLPFDSIFHWDVGLAVCSIYYLQLVLQ